MTYTMKDFELAKAELEHALQEIKTESEFVAILLNLNILQHLFFKRLGCDS